MKAIILYASKSGAAKECAERLSVQLNCPYTDLAQQKTKTDIREYETIIIGTGVRMGKIYKPAKVFIRQNLDILLTKKSAIFLCNAYPDTFQKAVAKNLPGELIQHAVSIKSFGGKQPYRNPQNSEWINIENFTAFINEII